MREKPLPYHIGCPVWGHKSWVGSLFRPGSRPGDFLEQYARVFNTVEGNTTFYGLPSPDAVRRWEAAVPDDFRFAFKFPRTITHEKGLRHAEAETREFLDALQPVAARIGVLFLQLPPGFGHSALPALEAYLAALPRDFHYAVEVRNGDFFDGGDGEARLDALLSARGVDRALFDTGTLHSLMDDDPGIRAAQSRKPRHPARLTATGPRPFLRFVGGNAVDTNLPRLRELAGQVAAWIGEGRRPYVFIHAPDEHHAPALCRRFHELVGDAVGGADWPSLPPGAGEAAADEGQAGGQLSLF